MILSLEDPDDMAAHTFDETASEPADICVVELDGVLGSCVKVASPEYLA